jgi:hypothetical protein
LSYPPVAFRKFVDILHVNGQKFMIIVDPGLSRDFFELTFAF